MTRIMSPVMSPVTSPGPEISRRSFLAGVGGLTFSIAFLGDGAPVLNAAGKEGPPAVSAWVRIGADNVVTIFNPAAEMGQGSMTALPLIVAEEMDADWARVRIEYAPIEATIYGNPNWFGGQMLTVGSRTVQGYYDSLRLAGARVRKVLLEAAAGHWKVPVAELGTEPNVVMHGASGRRLTYGEIAAFAKMPARLPAVGAGDLKKPSEFRLIGNKSIGRSDIPAKVNGQAVYGMDVQVPGMVYAVMSRAPVNGSRPLKSNGAEIKRMPGIVDVVTLNHGVVVVADTMEGAMNARKSLKVEWSKGAKAEGFQSEKDLDGYQAVARGDAVGETLTRKGDVKTAKAAAVKSYQADFFSDHAYHAQMEPLNAVAHVNAAGDGAEVWAGTQSLSGARMSAAKALGVGVDRIAFHPCYLGGGFGRRSWSDYIEEAVLTSKAVKRPVKLVWSREDDLGYGAFRPMALQCLKASVDKDGTIVTWEHCVVGDGKNLLTSGIKIPFYGVPNQLIELRGQSSGVRLKHWRAVGHGFNKFAIESMVDLVAADLKIDPVEMRRRLTAGSPRAWAVVETAARMAGWGKPRPEGRAVGIAFAERSDSFSAGVAEISLDRAKGRLRVHRFWAALDAGVVVQPANAVAQMESGIVYGLSSMISERVTFENGRVQQSNFHDYEVMRMADAPEEIHVELIPSQEPPVGIGESGVPIASGAVANAFFALTGRQIRHMPFTPERVREVLKA